MSGFLEVETEETIFEVRFSQIQIEITGRCNMRCQHCRGSEQIRQDMPIGQIEKVVSFARLYATEDQEITLSGGEPLLHHNFSEVLRGVRAKGADLVTLTTNGSILKASHLDLIERLAFRGLALSISLDSTDSETHDKFRMRKGAYAKALEALRLASNRRIPGFTYSLRSSVTPERFTELEALVSLARDYGCKRVGFSGIQPVGRAAHRKDMWMSREQKREFLERVQELSRAYPDIGIRVNDPLQCLLNSESDIEVDAEGERTFGGCGASVVTFNVNADGTMTPCAMLDIPMMNIFSLTIGEMTELYRSNRILQSMLTMSINGKCGSCPNKFRCGGCRARALADSGDYLGEDPHCWR
jgi:AdoMet-dependent heme synthase